MPRPLVYLLYNLLLPFVLLLGLPAFIIKGVRRGGLARNFAQRLGFFSPDFKYRIKDRKPVWIHAVSVGEIFIALKLIEALRRTSPGLCVVLSTTTTTGYRLAAEKADENLLVIHNPVDLPWIAYQVIQAIDPAIFVLIEAEIWPNLVGLLKRRGVSVLLVNARLSPRSEGRYGRVRPLIAPVFSLLDGVTVPYPEDAARWAALGVAPERILVTGSIKFDQSVASTNQVVHEQLAGWLARTGMPADSRVILGGSTHDGEELLLARAVRDLKGDFENLELVLVPRHAERGGEIASRLRDAGFDPVLKNGVNRVESPLEEGKARIWIANTTGELRTWYGLAELVVIGKSFRAGGGQNPVEPILAGCPVIVGPHMENFAEVMEELHRVTGLRQLSDETDLNTTLREFLTDSSVGIAMASRGAAIMTRHLSAATRNAQFVLSRVIF